MMNTKLNHMQKQTAHEHIQNKHLFLTITDVKDDMAIKHMLLFEFHQKKYYCYEKYDIDLFGDIGWFACKILI